MSKEKRIFNLREGRLGVEVTKVVRAYGDEDDVRYVFGIMPNGYQTIGTPAMNLQHLLILRTALNTAIEDAKKSNVNPT
jgi:hypothetical protein